MFEVAELGRKVSKADYEKQLPGLRAGLLEAQLELKAAGVPVILVFSGADGAGKSETVQRLHEWLDPRGLRTLSEDKETSWRVSPLEWKHYKLYGRFIKASEQVVRRTDTSGAPWFLVEAEDEPYRELMVGRALLEAMRRRLAGDSSPAVAAAARPSKDPVAAPLPLPKASAPGLDHVDLGRRRPDPDYKKKLLKLQRRLHELARAAAEKNVSSVAVFEGWDAAGKGGGIRRLTDAMDPRLYRVSPIAAPSDEEKSQHYLL